MSKRSIIVLIIISILNLSFIPSANAFILEALGTLIVDKWVDNKIEKASNSVAVEMRVEFLKAMDKLFDEKIRPLLKEINQIIKERIAQVDKVFEQRLEQVNTIMEKRLKQIDDAAKDRLAQIEKIVDEWLQESNKIIEERLNQVDDITRKRLEQANALVKDRLEQLNSIINNAAEKFSQATAQTIDKIKTDVIQEAAIRIDDLRIKFKQDAKDAFDRIDLIIVTVDCSVEKARMDVERLRDDILPNWCMWCELPECYKELGLQGPPKPFEYTTIYRINKCEVLKTLTPETPITRILDVYTDLMAWSARIACIQRSAGPGAKNDYAKEWFRLQRDREIWSNTQQ